MINELQKLLKKGDLRENVPMSSLTTFRTGGPVKLLISPGNTEELAGVIRLLNREKTPWFVLGRGSNLLVSDSGYDGVIISLREHFQSVAQNPEKGLLTADAGVLLTSLSNAACAASLSGLEFVAGIPGTVGGGLFMNAGAYGGELSQVVTEAAAVTPQGELLTVPVEEMELGHRKSRFMRTGEIITSCSFRLSPGRQEDIRAVMNDLNARRRDKQPLEYPSAGSTFKRPEGFFASKLIDDAGLKGFSRGGAQVSEKHAGFVINRGDATAEDIYLLCRDIRRIVFEKFGVKLELEVQLLGEFPEEECPGGDDCASAEEMPVKEDYAAEASASGGDKI